ncbi:protein FAM169B [Aplochiton taeniatus]
MYPIDFPALEYSVLSSASEQHASSVESNSLHGKEWFVPLTGSKVEVKGSDLIRLQVFGEEQSACTLLALRSPDDKRVLALYLHGQWWSLEDTLKTACQSKTGLVTVLSVMERVVLFLLSQVVERVSTEPKLFSPHSRTEQGKLSWWEGEAVGFYTVKPRGSLCCSHTSQSYRLPVLDTVLVRRRARRRGLGLHMLQDFCSSFPNEEVLGISYPLSPSMAAVCRKYLQQHEDQRDRLYEVEAPGAWDQRRNIWLNIQLRRYRDC